MANISQLTAANFYLSGKQGQSLAINFPGNMLVFFKLDRCPDCNEFYPRFFELAAEERRVTFGIVNLSISRDVVNLASMSSTPINGVPLFLLYINGFPTYKYTGELTIPSMKSFIVKALINVENTILERQQQFIPPNQRHIQHQSKIPSVQYEEESILTEPKNVIPYNTPWEADESKGAGFNYNHNK